MADSNASGNPLTPISLQWNVRVGYASGQSTEPSGGESSLSAVHGTGRSITAGCSMNATIRLGPAHRGDTSGSPSYTCLIRCAQQELREPLGHGTDGPPNRRRDWGAEGGVLDLDADHCHPAGQLCGQIPGNHGGRERVGEGVEAGSVLPVEPADRAGRITHLGRIHQDDEVGRETPDRSGTVLRRVRRLDHKDGKRNGPGSIAPSGPLSFQEPLRDQGTRSVVAIEHLPDPHHRHAVRPGRGRRPVTPGPLL